MDNNKDTHNYNNCIVTNHDDSGDSSDNMEHQSPSTSKNSPLRRLRRNDGEMTINFKDMFVLITGMINKFSEYLISHERGVTENDLLHRLTTVKKILIQHRGEFGIKDIKCIDGNLYIIDDVDEEDDLQKNEENSVALMKQPSQLTKNGHKSQLSSTQDPQINSNMNISGANDENLNYEDINSVAEGSQAIAPQLNKTQTVSKKLKKTVPKRASKSKQHQISSEQNSHELQENENGELDKSPKSKAKASSPLASPHKSKFQKVNKTNKSKSPKKMSKLKVNPVSKLTKQKAVNEEARRMTRSFVHEMSNVGQRGEKRKRSSLNALDQNKMSRMQYVVQINDSKLKKMAQLRCDATGEKFATVLKKLRQEELNRTLQRADIQVSEVNKATTSKKNSGASSASEKSSTSDPTQVESENDNTGELRRNSLNISLKRKLYCADEWLQNLPAAQE